MLDGVFWDANEEYPFCCPTGYDGEDMRRDEIADWVRKISHNKAKNRNRITVQNEFQSFKRQNDVNTPDVSEKTKRRKGNQMHLSSSPLTPSIPHPSSSSSSPPPPSASSSSSPPPPSALPSVHHTSFLSEDLHTVGRNRKKCIDILLNLSVYVDSIVCFALGKVKEMTVVNIVVNNAKDVDRGTRAMSHFVLIAKDKADIPKQIALYLEVNKILGLYGAYFNRPNYILHIRWFVSGIHGDYVAQEEMNDTPNKMHSYFPSIRDPNQEQLRLNLLEGRMIRMGNSCFTKYDRYMSICSQSLECQPENSVLRLITYLYHHPNAKVNGRETIDSFFSLFKKGLTLWLPPAISRKKSNELRKKQLLMALKDIIVGNKEDFLEFFVKSLIQTADDSILDVERDEEKIIESVVDKFMNMNVPDAKAKTEVISIDNRVWMDHYSIFILDAMHEIPNFMKQCLTYLNGIIPNGARKQNVHTYLESFLGYVSNPTDQTPIKIYSINPSIMATASHRISLCNTTRSWMERNILIPSFYAALRNDECIKFALCYFTYVFQDSMDNPFVFSLKCVLDCIGYLYNCNRNLNEAAGVQNTLNFFVGLMQSLAPPHFTNISVTNTRYFWDILAFYGDAKSADCFQNESSLRLVKGASKPSPNEEKTVAKRIQILENVETFTRIIPEDIVIECDDSNKMTTNTSIYSLSESMIYGIADDYSFWKDNSVPHYTYLDAILDNKTDEWIEEHLITIIDYSVEYFSSIRFEGVTLTSCNPHSIHSLDPNSKLDFHYLIKCKDSLVVTRDYTGNPRLFLICGFALFECQSQQKVFKYVQALCLPIPLVSGNSAFHTQFYSFVKEEDLQSLLNTQLIPISLFRFQDHVVHPFIFNEKLLYVSFETKCIRQTRRLKRYHQWNDMEMIF